MTLAELKGRRRRIAERMREGATVEQVADEFMVSEGLVWKSCHEYGIRLKHGDMTDAFRCLLLLVAGGAPSQVARTTGIRRTTVDLWRATAERAGWSIGTVIE